MADNVRLTVDIDLDDFIENGLFNIDNDQILQFIKDIDRRIENWDFTCKLYEHFRNLHQIFLDEVEDI